MSDSKDIRPYVPAETDLRELTFKALFFGLVFAVVLGAANAYVGLKAGLTVSATFPAAVMAMAVLRGLKGSVLEENITRTTAAVGEALVAGAIFTIPAFFMTGVWDEMNYWESTLIMLIGGVIGVLFVILLRRALIEDRTLPFPESVACSEIIKAGQKGQSGAKFVFGALGLSAVLEFFKNPNGLMLFSDTFSRFIHFNESKVQFLKEGNPVGEAIAHRGGLILQSPLASPAMLGVGYIIGPRLAAINFSGGVFCWFVLVPLALFFDVGLTDVAAREGLDWISLGKMVWNSTIRPLAVGAMLVGAVYTLYSMRQSLFQGLGRAVRDMNAARSGGPALNRFQQDIPFTYIFISIAVMIVPMFFLYQYFVQNWGGALVATLIMVVTGFLFSAVGGYLVGLIGGSNQPISGLALSSLVISALVMVGIGVKGNAGVAAVLATAAVVCVASAMAGDMIQDLKVGEIIGGTPWKMEVVEIIGAVVVSFVLIFPMTWLHQGTPGGIGGENLPAPQAGLMAMMSKGIVGGDMPWSLVLVGVGFGIGLVLVRAPSPMLIAVGMYLSFYTTAAIFIGGVIKWLLDQGMDWKKLAGVDRIKAENLGVLIASGLVAGEAMTGVLLAALYVAGIQFSPISENPYAGLLMFPLIGFILIYFPIRSILKGEAPDVGVKME